MEQRAVIKFQVKLGKTATETYRLMKQVYGDICLSRTVIFDWHKRFLGGRETLEDDKHTGRPVTTRTPQMIEKVREFVAEHRNASLRLMEDTLKINKETIRTILQEDLGKTKEWEAKVTRTVGNSAETPASVGGGKKRTKANKDAVKKMKKSATDDENVDKSE